MIDYQVTLAPTHEPITLAQVKLQCRLDTAEIGTTEDNLLKGYIAAARAWAEQYQNRAYIYQTITAKLDKFSNSIELTHPPLISVDSITYVDNNGTTQTLASNYYDVDTTSDPGKVTLAYNQTWPSIRGDHHGVAVTYKAGYVSACTADTDADTITANEGTYNVDDVVRLYTTDTLPAGLSVNTDYYVLTVSGKAITLATSSGGSTIDITDTGTGTHYIDAVPPTVKAALLMLVGHLYENREALAPLQLHQVPFGVQCLLDIDRIIPL